MRSIRKEIAVEKTATQEKVEKKRKEDSYSLTLMFYYFLLH